MTTPVTNGEETTTTAPGAVETSTTPAEGVTTAPEADSPAADGETETDIPRVPYQRFAEQTRKLHAAEAKAAQLEEELGRARPQIETFERARPEIQAVLNHRAELAEKVETLQASLEYLTEVKKRAEASGVELPDPSGLQQANMLREIKRGLSSLSSIDDKIASAFTRQEQARAEREAAAAAKATETQRVTEFNKQFAAAVKDAPELATLKDGIYETWKRQGGKVSDFTDPFVTTAKRSKATKTAAELAVEQKLPIVTKPGGAPGVKPEQQFQSVDQWLRSL